MTQDTCHRSHDTGHMPQVTGHETGQMIQDTGHMPQVTGHDTGQMTQDMTQDK
jgi:hypothetical protein